VTDGFRIVIPARYAATRLPGKPLRKLGDKTLIEHTLAAAERAGAVEVVVATDDERVASTVKQAGGRALMTATDHACGTDRVAEVTRYERWPDREIVVNLQGDEPAIDPRLLRRVASALVEHPSAGIATLATPIRTVEELFDPHAVKVVCDSRGMASYFSRAPIPWVRGEFDLAKGPLARLPKGVTFLRHLGLYAYRAETLRALAGKPPCEAELAESLEQLRALWHGIGIHVSVVEASPHGGVDTEDDLRRVEQLLQSTRS
jgi:3-deoxy-manno-octulosonate cytidylyltransferase (CMP-KDO synthetase)